MLLKANLTISFDAFIKLVADELNADIKTLSAETVFRNLPQWSSLNALIFLSRINEETGVVLTSGDLSSFSTLKDIFDFINKR